MRQGVDINDFSDLIEVLEQRQSDIRELISQQKEENAQNMIVCVFLANQRAKLQDGRGQRSYIHTLI